MADLVITTGLIGQPIARSLSLAMHNAAFAAAGLAEQYALWPTEPADLAERVAMLRQAPLRGANITIPHKTAVLELLDSLDPTAEAIGAVNTIVRQANGTLHGLNTDSPGFMQALARTGYNATGRVAVVLGAGGAARAVAYGLINAGLANLTVANRTLEHAEGLLADLLATTERDPELYSIALDDPALRDFIAAADLLINATAVGSDDQALPVPADWLHSRLLVSDLMYRSTPLLRAAKAAAIRAEDGLEMLVQQAALAWNAWTGLAAPIDTMRSAAQAARAEQRATQ